MDRNVIRNPNLYGVTEMQFQGGFRYPSGRICVVLSIVAILVTGAIWFYRCLAWHRTLALFLNLEGVVLLASALTPTGLKPPPKGIIEKVRWFRDEQGAVPLSYNQPMFYGGLFLIFLAVILSELIR